MTTINHFGLGKIDNEKDMLTVKHYKALEFLQSLGCEVCGYQLNPDGVSGHMGLGWSDMGKELWIMSEQRAYALMEVNDREYLPSPTGKDYGAWVYSEDLADLHELHRENFLFKQEKLKAMSNAPLPDEKTLDKMVLALSDKSEENPIKDIPAIATENLTVPPYVHPASLTGNPTPTFTPRPFYLRSRTSSFTLTTRHLFALTVLEIRGVSVYGMLPGHIEYFMPLEQAEKLLNSMGCFYDGMLYTYVGKSDDEDTEELPLVKPPYSAYCSACKEVQFINIIRELSDRTEYECNECGKMITIFDWSE